MKRMTKYRNMLAVLSTIGVWVSPVAAQTFTTIDDPLGTTGTYVRGISGNNIVGIYAVTPYKYDGFLYNGSTYTTIDDPLGVGSTSAFGIDGNNIVGTYYDGSQNRNHGFLYNGSTYTTIDDPLGPMGTVATGISGKNIAGYYYDSTNRQHGFLYNGLTYTTIDDPLGANGNSGTVTFGVDGNNIVGEYEDSSNVYHGFLYNGSTYTTIDDPLAVNGSEGTFLTGISGKNIVGWYDGKSSGDHGFLYNGSTFTTIDDPLVQPGRSSILYGISGNNIGGEYYDTSGKSHGFEATVAPEPSSFALLGSALLGLGLVYLTSLVRNPKSLRRRGLLAALLVAAATLAVHEARADIAYSWGDNQNGELGDGTRNNRPTPGAVIGLTSGVTAVSGGKEFGLAVQNGGAYVWGVDIYGVGPLTAVAVPGLSSGVTAVAGGSNYSLAVQNGAVYAWGYNGFGAFGNGTTSSGGNTPVAVNAPLTSGVTAIAAGNDFSMAVKNGGLYAWGFQYSLTPVPVTGFESGVTAITPNLAVQNGALYSVSSSAAAPFAEPGLGSGVTAIAQGRYHDMAVRNGGVYGWGLNNYGELGDGTTTEHDTPEQIDPVDLHDIVAVAAGQASSYALSSDGSLWVWGDNTFGEMGLGNTFQSDYLTPQHLLPPSGYMFISIAGGPFDDDFAIATLAPVPEPGTLALLCAGLLLLAVCRKGLRTVTKRG